MDVAVGLALEHEIAARGQSAAIMRTWRGHGPHRALSHRIPRRERTLAAVCRRIAVALGKADELCGQWNRVPPVEVFGRVAAAEHRRHLDRRYVHVSGARTEGLWIEIVHALETRPERHRAVHIAGIRRLDGTTGSQVHLL